MNNQMFTVAIYAFFLVVLLSFCFVVYHACKFANLSRQALMSGAPVTYLELLGMSFRKVPMAVIVKARIKAKHADLDIDGPEGCTVERLERQFLAGGDVDRVVKALIVAKSKGIELDFASAAQTDLAEQS